MFTDPDGRAPRNMTEPQRNLYKASVQSQHPANIPNKYDCADTVIHIYNSAMKAATGQDNSYENISKNGQKLTNLQDIQAGDMFGTSNAKNKIVNYYQNDGTQSYDSSKADRSFNSPNIEIGTVGIYKPATAEDAKYFSGHSITVTGVTRDKNGNVTAINYIEGHMNNHDQEEHTFTINGTGDSSLYNKYSDCKFVGWGEIEL